MLSIIRLGLVCHLFYDLTKPTWKKLYLPEGVYYDPLMEQLQDPTDGPELMQLLIRHFESKKKIDNAPLNCALEFVIDFIREGSVRNHLPLMYWEPSVGSILAYIYENADINYPAYLEADDLEDNAIDRLLGTDRIQVHSSRHVFLCPFPVPKDRLLRLMGQAMEDNPDPDCYLGRFGSEVDVMRSVLPPGIANRLSFIYGALMNESITLETKRSLLEDCFSGGLHRQTKREYADSMVLLMARSNQPIELYDVLYFKRKEVMPAGEIELERALMTDAPDEECLEIDLNANSTGFLFSLAVVKKRSYQIFKKILDNAVSWDMPHVNIRNRLDDALVLWTFPIFNAGPLGTKVDTDALRNALSYFTPPAAITALRLLLSKSEASIIDIAKLFSLSDYRDLNATIFQVIIEWQLEKNQFDPSPLVCSYFPVAVNLMAFVLRQFSDSDREKLTVLLSNYTGWITPEDGHYLISSALEHFRS